VVVTEEIVVVTEENVVVTEEIVVVTEENLAFICISCVRAKGRGFKKLQNLIFSK